MARLLLLIPALVHERRHVEHVRVQSLLRDRLRRHKRSPGLSIFSCVVYDEIAAECFDDVLGLPFDVKLFSSDMDPGASPIGIRRPTDHALSRLGRIFPDTQHLLVVRVIQDTVVLDAGAFLDDLLSVAGSVAPNDRDYLAGELSHCDDIGGHMDALGLPRRPDYLYVQGAVLFAPFRVWQRHYPRMPAAVTHWCDDSVFSQMVVASGGELLPLLRRWEHRHDCPVETSRETFVAQLEELNRGVARGEERGGKT